MSNLFIAHIQSLGKLLSIPSKHILNPIISLFHCYHCGPDFHHFLPELLHSLLTSLPILTLPPIKSALNRVFRVILLRCQSYYVSFSLRISQWLSILFRVKAKILSLPTKALWELYSFPHPDLDFIFCSYPLNTLLQPALPKPVKYSPSSWTSYLLFSPLECLGFWLLPHFLQIRSNVTLLGRFFCVFVTNVFCNAKPM